MFNKNKGFTLIELMVVMIIIVIMGAMLLPVINKGRAKANVESAKAEMASLSSTASIIMMDTGQYLRLVDYPYQRGTLPPTPTIYAFIWDATPQPPETVQVQTTVLADDGYIHPDSWNGPYHTYSAGDQFVASTVGSYPVCSSSPPTGVNEWNLPSLTDNFPDGTPLDPWGHPYGLAWSDHNTAYDAHNGEDVMVIYSAGPDGTLNTPPGCPLAKDADGDYSDESDYDGDDLIFRFR